MNRHEGERLLRQMLGDAALFRPGQWEAVDAVAIQRQRLLVVQRTGWGKSVVYFLATKILRAQGGGPTLLISPLLSLMRNQLEMTRRLGLQAATVNSANEAEWAQVKEDLRENRCDLLMISPERLANRTFAEEMLPLFQGRASLLVVDEAHCISDWGHDFRPDYRRIVRLLRRLPPQAPALCTTATANDRVVRDIVEQIPKLHVSRGPLARESLKLFTIPLPDQAERLAWLAHFLPKLPGSGIVYCLTVPDTRRVTHWLVQQGIQALAYHADMDHEQRIAAEQKLIHNEVKALVATVALGMGFDKPDLGFVIHFQRPGSVIAYYQQVGRAGRAVESAYGILLSGQEDDEIQEYFIETAFPRIALMQAVLKALEEQGEQRLDELLGRLNCSWGMLEKALKLLEVDGAVERNGRAYSRTANPWTPDPGRADQIRGLRRAELEEIKRYVTHAGCLMKFLARALDDPAARECGKCMNCTRHTARQFPPAELVRQGRVFLRGDELVLEPKAHWPMAVLETLAKAWPEALAPKENGGWKITIPAGLRSEPGRVLSVYGDAGWGGEVARGKYETDFFSDELVDAAFSLVRHKWKPEPAPTWVAWVPSLHRPQLMRHFAERLAARLGLPCLDAVKKVSATPPQKEMQNGPMQIRNLVGAFAAQGEVPGGPVLLVDDVVDSGWTLTLIGVLLRQHGSGAVYPFALAKASPKGSQ